MRWTMLVHCEEQSLSAFGYQHASLYGILLQHWARDFLHTFPWQSQHIIPRSHEGFTTTTWIHDLASLEPLARLANHTQNMRQLNALSQHFNFPLHRIPLLISLSAPSLARPTRSPVVPSSRPVCTYIYQATECELAPLTSQISNVHPATLS
jgi:hypothetical protein